MSKPAKLIQLDRYEGIDPREMPNYGVTEVARYLRIPASKLRAWVRGVTYPGTPDKKPFKPLIKLAEREPGAMSFMNLVEAHVLNALRRRHGLSLQAVRKALNYLGRKYPSDHPLADHDFATEGYNIFIEKYGDLINASQDGQLVMKKLIEAHLKRIERDEHGLASKLYPFVRLGADPSEEPEEERPIWISPLHGFGRPTMAGTGIAAEAIAERFVAGDSIEELMWDYDLERTQVENALRFILKRPQAA